MKILEQKSWVRWKSPRMHLEDNGETDSKLEDRPIQEKKRKGDSSYLKILWLNYSIFKEQIDIQIQKLLHTLHMRSKKPQSLLLKTED